MAHPPILTNDFLVTCLQYEHIRTRGHVRQAYKHIGEMMCSTEVRQEVIRHAAERAGELAEDAPEEVPRLNRGPIGPHPFHYPHPDDDIIDDDDQISIWSGVEDDQKVITFSEPAIFKFFKRCEMGYNLEPGFIVPRDDRVTLLDLKDISHSYYWPNYPVRTFRTPDRYDTVKSIVDFDKIKVCYTKSLTNETFEVGYWQGDEGCWIWFGDDVKFIQRFTYELLAAREWLKCVEHSDGQLGSLEFDIADKTKWSPLMRHRTYFWKKIQKIKFQPPIKTKMFSMKCLKNRKVEYQPFDIRSISSLYLKTIKLRVWDDSYALERPIDRVFTLGRYLQQMESTYPWRAASELDVNDPELDWFYPQQSTTFLEIKREKITTNDVKQFREVIHKGGPLITYGFKPCTVTGQMNMKEFLDEPEYGGVEVDGVYTFNVPRGNIIRTSREFSTTIEENKVTFNLI